MHAFTAANQTRIETPPPFEWGAAGITMMANDTKRLLALKRSFFWPDCKSGGVWCNAGGGREHYKDRTPLCTALRETEEEIRNFRREMIIGEPELAFVYHGRSGANPRPFYNYIAMVREEFMPELDLSENTEARWLREEEWPQPMHYGMEAFFKDSHVRDLLATKRVCPRAHLSAPRDALFGGYNAFSPAA